MPGQFFIENTLMWRIENDEFKIEFSIEESRDRDGTTEVITLTVPLPEIEANIQASQELAAFLYDHFKHIKTVRDQIQQEKNRKQSIQHYTYH